MDLTISILLIVLLALLFFYVRGKGSSGESDPAAKKAVKPVTTTKYHSVSIRTAGKSCSAANAIEGQRYLSSEAPQLPLADCDRPEKCRCRFIHHEDRRSGDERRNPYRHSISADTGSYREEQRKRGDRRQDPPDYFE